MEDVYAERPMDAAALLFVFTQLFQTRAQHYMTTTVSPRCSTRLAATYADQDLDEDADPIDSALACLASSDFGVQIGGFIEEHAAEFIHHVEETGEHNLGGWWPSSQPSAAHLTDSHSAALSSRLAAARTNCSTRRSVLRIPRYSRVYTKPLFATLSA